MSQSFSLRVRIWMYLALLVIVGSPYFGRIFEPVARAQETQLKDDEAGLSPTNSSETRPPAEGKVPSGDPAAAAPRMIPQSPRLNALELLFQGGVFMIPIVILCFVGTTCAIERWIGLRRSRVLPRRLVKELGQLAAGRGTFDPRVAYRLCQQYPSAAATVIRSMLHMIGRPRGEIEHVVQETSEREAERLYRNVRWLNLCSSVTPLIGLLGTIQGMIIAFYDTTQLAPGQNKATVLAHGIYIALVTTFGGLVVAIPAATLSHYFEGRIQYLFHEVEELMFNLLPQLERYEGKVRFSRQTGELERDTTSEPPPFKLKVES